MTPPQFTRGRDSATQHKIDLAFDLVDYVFDKVELKDKYMDSKIRVVQRLVYREALRKSMFDHFWYTSEKNLIFLLGILGL